jgi:signal transduction histidine kinase
MKRPLQVLVVEDSAGDARMLQEMFRKEKSGSFELTYLVRMNEALARLKKGDVDVVLLDMGLPDGHGLDTVRRAQAVAPNVPIIVLTGLEDEALAAEAMKEGAQDYLIKGQIESRALPRALRHAIERHRLQSETDLIRTNQLQFKDNFLSHVSHELRSPLNAIYQFVAILSDNVAGELTQVQHEYLDIVLRNVKQLQAMIDDLLEVTRVQAGKLTFEAQCTSVTEAITDVVDTLQGAASLKAIALSVEVGAEVPPVCADPTRLRQILIILLDNAIKFTPEHGVVRLSAHVQDKEPTHLVIQVADTGRGIGADMTERIFDRLFQEADPSMAGRQGLGLGLHICRELVALQGGKIWATSILGRGSQFVFTLPIFSMTNLLTPMLRKISETQGSMTLVVAEIGSTSGWLSDEARAEHSQSVRELLRRCLHTAQDVLLPKMGTAGAAELFFIVAATDLTGGESLTKRIRDLFDDRNPLQMAGLTLATSCKSVEVDQSGAGDSNGSVVEIVAGAIHALVDEEFSSRMVANG